MHTHGVNKHLRNLWSKPHRRGTSIVHTEIIHISIIDHLAILEYMEYMEHKGVYRARHVHIVDFWDTTICSEICTHGALWMADFLGSLSLSRRQRCNRKHEQTALIPL
jgi:hypothetical protein